MIKNRPWQIIALIAVHTASLGYMLYMFLRTYPVLAYAGPPIIFSVALGLISLACLLLRHKAGLVLEIIFTISFVFAGIYHLHYVDILVYAAAMLYLILSSATRRYYGFDARESEEGENEGASGENSSMKRLVLLVAVSVAISALLVPIMNNLDKAFYMTHSKSDYKLLLSYIEQNYADAQIDSSGYKEFGYIFLTLPDGRSGSVQVTGGSVDDRIILDVLEKEYEERLAKSNGDYVYMLNLSYSSEDGAPCAYIWMYGWAMSWLGSGETVADSAERAAFYDPELYRVFCELVEKGYRVIIAPPTGMPEARPIIYVDSSIRRSLLFPFLNTKQDVAKNRDYSEEYLTFTQICPEREFYSKLDVFVLKAEERTAGELAELFRSEWETGDVPISYPGRGGRALAYLASMIPAIMINLPLYILNSIGCYTLMKNRGLKKRWIAWIPLVSWLSLAAVRDDIERKYGRQSRRLIHVLIMMGVIVAPAVLLPFAMLASRNYVFSENPELLRTFSTLGTILFFVLYIMLIVTYYSCLWYVFNQYSPKNKRVFKVLSLLVGSVSIPVILFCIRNNTPLQDRPPAPGEDVDGYHPVTFEERDLGDVYSNLSNRLYNAGLYEGPPDMPPPETPKYVPPDSGLEEDEDAKQDGE